MMLGEVILTLGKRREVVHDLKLPMQAGSRSGEVHRGEVWMRSSTCGTLWTSAVWKPGNSCNPANYTSGISSATELLLWYSLFAELYIH